MGFIGQHHVQTVIIKLPWRQGHAKNAPKTSLNWTVKANHGFVREQLSLVQQQYTFFHTGMNEVIAIRKNSSSNSYSTCCFNITQGN